MGRGTTLTKYYWLTCMVGSRAERQQHIHSISKCNDENLACADYLPTIVWPVRQSCSSDLFCSAALITSSFVTTNSRRGWWSWIEQVLIMRLTWHFYITCQVRSWRSKQFMNVILQTLIDWFPYGKGILTHHPSSQKLNLEECKTLP